MIVAPDGIFLERQVIRHQSHTETINTYEEIDFMQTLMVGREITGISGFAPKPSTRRAAERNTVS